MKRRKFLILFLFAMLILSCTKVTEEQRIVEEFNKHKYGVNLEYIDGEYELVPAQIIDANSIKNLLDGRSWCKRMVAQITPERYNDGPFDGEAYTVITFSGEKARIVSIPEDPTASAVELDVSVTYGDNLFCLEELGILGIVCSTSDSKVYYLERGVEGMKYKNNKWTYLCLEAQ